MAKALSHKAYIKIRLFYCFLGNYESLDGVNKNLAIAHPIIVEKYGDILEVNSVQEEGTEFVIQIPGS
ncbi:MAG: hypothetical protein V7L01_04540 [Nostoc sp.]|uniref:hypothetical protein n=1 Tax=Nostoc sp. TaxID=1180 RepID=UPI002FF5F6F5